jgi:3-oxoacyl-[acyl-carrier-protein] synthase-1
LRDILLHECGAITEWVADQLNIRDYVTTISTACSSSANAIFFGARLIRHGLLDVVVAGGADALTKFTLNGFNTLMILDQQYCKPFDENRKGLNLGEGAGYTVLVSARVAASLQAGSYCRLSGFCNANDAFHQTASSPDGTGSYLAMKGALERSGLQPSDIGYINLHGTGTQNNDSAEGAAIRRLFDPQYPRMSSTKSFTGHTLGACGGLEAVFSALSVRYGLIYPNLRLETPMTDLPFVPVTNFAKNEPIEHALSNSFGFGGNCSSLVFSKL